MVESFEHDTLCEQVVSILVLDPSKSNRDYEKCKKPIQHAVIRTNDKGRGFLSKWFTSFNVFI